MFNLNIDLVICTYDRIIGDNQYILNNGIEEGLHENKDVFYYQHNKHGVTASRCCKVFKASILDNIIYKIDKTVLFAEDIQISILYALTMDKYYYIKTPMYHYRYYESDSVSKKFNEKAVSDIAKIYNSIKKFDFVYDEHLLNSTILELYLRLIVNILKQNDSDIRSNNYRILINEPLFKSVKRKANWNCKTKKEVAIKFLMQYFPMTYFKIVECRRKKRERLHENR